MPQVHLCLRRLGMSPVLVRHRFLVASCHSIQEEPNESCQKTSLPFRLGVLKMQWLVYIYTIHTYEDHSFTASLSQLCMLESQEELLHNVRQRRATPR